MFDQVLWFATRGAGAVSALMLTASVCLGLVTVTRFQHAEWPRFFNYEMHRRVSLLSIVFLAVHVLAAVFDPFTKLGLGAVLVPLASTYRPVPVALGVVALYLFVSLIATSLLRRHIGAKAWRAIHWASYAMWPIALAARHHRGHGRVRPVDAGHRRRVRGRRRRSARMADPASWHDDGDAGAGPADTRSGGRARMRVLVAEDDEGLREVLVLGLSDAGYHVDAVDRGDDAIDQLRWYEYDVAVIDWRMPGAEGIDVVAWARRHDRPDGPADAHRARHARGPDPWPRHRRGRLPRQALRLRGAARPRARAPAPAARRGRSRSCGRAASRSTR